MKYLAKIKTHIRNDYKIIVTIIKTLGSRGVSAAGTFFFNFILAVYLELADLGSFILMYSMLLGVNIFVGLGRETAILRFGSILYAERKIHSFNSLITKNILMSFSIGSLVSLVLIALRAPIISLIFEDNPDLNIVMILMAISLPIYSFLNIQSSFFKAMKNPEIAPFFETGSMLLISGLAVLFCSYFVKINLTIVGIIFLLSNSLVLLIGSLVLRKKISRVKICVPESQTRLESFYEILPDLTLQNIINYLFKYSSILLLGLYFTKEAVGFYSVANNIAFVINFILWVINSVYAPHFAKLYEDGDLKEMSRQYKNSIIYMLIISFPIFIVIVFFSKEILGLFGTEFSVASKGLMLLALSQLINVVTGPAIYLLNLTGYQKNIRNIILITAVLNLCFGYFLIPKFGFIGAIIATSVALISQNILAFSYVKKVFRI